MRTGKFNELITNISFSFHNGITMVVVGLTTIVTVKIGKKMTDFVWSALFEKGAKEVGNAVGTIVSKEVDKQITKRLKPVNKRLQNIDHKIKNQDIANIGSLDLILEKLNKIQNE